MIEGKNVYIFDLDGTLTDTLLDLAISTNYALCQMGYPTRTVDEVRRFVGNGVRRLMTLAVPAGISEEEFEQCFKIFKAHYIEHCQDNTDLYPGVSEMLHELKQRGIRLAIVSNKLQAGVDELCQRWFKDTVEVAIGEQEGLRHKPYPDMVAHVLDLMNASADEAVYIGDSEVDVATASNAGLPCISVLWGFRDKDFLIKCGAKIFVETPQELLLVK